MEDIIAVLDGRPELSGEIARSEDALRAYLRASFELLMSDSDFMESLPGHLPGDAASQARLDNLKSVIRGIVSIP